MRSRVLAALAGLGIAAALSGGAESQIRLDRPIGEGPGGREQQQPGPPSNLLTAVTPQQLIRLLQPAGWQKGEVLNLQNNIKAIKGEINGVPVFALMADCEGESCSNFTFLVFFPPQPVKQDFINAFNRERRFGRLYTEKNGNLTMAMDVILAGGVSPNSLATSAAIFGGTIKVLFDFKPE